MQFGILKYLVFSVFSITLFNCYSSGEITYEYLAAHQGKSVIFRSQIVKSPEQHPTRFMDSYDTVSGKINKKHETYVTLKQDERQIVLVSNESIGCHDSLEIEGIPRLVDLGGSTGKNSYSKIWIEVINYKCL